MARGTTNSSPSGPGESTVPNLGSAQQSSAAWMGISERVTDGTPGPRPESSHAKYGGEMDEGVLFKGTSAGMDSSTLKQVNAGMGGERSSSSVGQYGPGSPNYLAGGFGAREQMTIGGEKNEGRLVGDGVGSTPETDLNQYFNSGKMKVQMPREQYLAGTDEARSDNMATARRGLGKGYPRKDARNQSM